MKTPIEGIGMNTTTPNSEQPSLIQRRKVTFGESRMKRLRQFLLTGALLAGVLSTVSLALGAQKLWSGVAGDTFWSSGGNWSPAGIPGPSDNVTFTNDGVAVDFYANGGAVNNVVDAGFVTGI